jgi:YVTN family beta-propeller protein
VLVPLRRALVAVVAVLAALSACTPAPPPGQEPAAARSPVGTSSPTSPPTSPAPDPPPVRPQVPRMRPPSDERTLSLRTEIQGLISPKSVVAAPDGRVFAQNMMYRHTVTVYSSGGRLLDTVSDAVRLDRFGVPDHPGLSNGAPVEAAVSADGRSLFVSNYSMYGAGFGPEGSDVCTPATARDAGVSPSFVYRIGLRSLTVDAVYPVGLVPKYVATTPDGRYLLVTNWCSYSLTVIRLSTGRPVADLELGAYPRGIAVTADSRRAYVAVMGSTSLAVVDLHRLRLRAPVYVGAAPRHVLLDPRDRFIYVTLNNEASVVKVDRRTGRVVDRAVTGEAPRSMAMAPDGRTLYVVNYLADTLSVVRASDMAVLQTIPTGDEPVPSHPIGVTYNRAGHRVWVALYSGAILVFDAR